MAAATVHSVRLACKVVKEHFGPLAEVRGEQRALCIASAAANAEQQAPASHRGSDLQQQQQQQQTSTPAALP